MMHALIYGGVQVRCITTETRVLYDGVYVEHKGSTYDMESGMWKPAFMSISMSPQEALDLAARLIREADAHGRSSQKAAKALVNRLHKRLSLND